MKVLHVDENHPVLVTGLERLGYENIMAYKTPLDTLWTELPQYDGMIIRSRFPIDKNFIDQASGLKFIGRVGAGMENIDISYAKQKGIALFAAPEGNRNAVGEHTLGMLLTLLNKLRLGHASIQSGEWLREAHRGWELKGQTLGIIGYGHMGKHFAEKLQGLGVRVLCTDRKPNVGNSHATQVPLKQLQQEASILSLHTDQNPTTQPLIDGAFIAAMKQPFWLINTARGSAVDSDALVAGLQSGKILGAGLDVLEYESTSFQSIFNKAQLPRALSYLLQADNVLLSPHVGGWTMESHKRLATTLVAKIKHQFHTP
jgi:D-3-phosphoglycerate dehydrogenase